ncbi:MAG: ATP-binding protein [Bacteroidia bacterium]|nr:ATP-binding protein [Bacteroidia bacterium]
METKYAPAERSSFDNILKKKLSLDKITYLNDIFCSLSYIFCILDDNRQIVFTNDILMKTLQIENVNQVLGKRFGEVIDCRFAFTEEAGCGTTEHCRYCGAVNAIMQCQKTNLKTTSECRIRRMVNGTENFLDVEVTATPFVHENLNYTIFSLIDITDRKRRAIIEKIFFHDVLNVASGLQGFFEIFDSIDEEEQQGFIQMGASLCQQIIDEIDTQRLLVQAENHELAVNRQMIGCLPFVQQIALDLQLLEVAKGKNIVINEDSVDVPFESDPVLLRRVLNNMVKNALEASTEGQTVTISVNKIGQRLKFSVHNPKFISRDIEMQVFMRSFSTKGKQRGLGTYSMKILGEQCLGGIVNFTTSETEGTTFFIVL